MEEFGHHFESVFNDVLRIKANIYSALTTHSVYVKHFAFILTIL